VREAHIHVYQNRIESRVG